MLSKRLLALIDLIPDDARNLADVGADHGYLICEAYRQGKIKKGLAIENKKGPYFNLLATIDSYHFNEAIAASFSEGLTCIDASIDTVVIAGMGAQTIINILENDSRKLDMVKYLIIDTHNDWPRVRQYLCERNFIISREVMIYEDGVYYELILFSHGQEEYSEDDYFFGPCLRREKDSLFENKWRGIIAKYQDIILMKDVSEIRKDELKKAIRRIENNL